MMVDHKTQKYDRQLRLWAANGQAMLEQSKVCLINGTATGAEALKNLILPGIGSFTVVDGKRVSGEDVGNNFFLDVDSIGTSRAKRVMELLYELNDDVEGFYLDEDAERLLETKPEFFRQFSLVIATALPESSVLRLAEICWSAAIPLIVAHVVGFVGYFRIAVPEHTVVESHPESIVDLRLDCPFPALREYAESLNFAEMDSLEHGHIPYVAILLKFMKLYKEKHGRAPSTSDEKSEFKAMIRSEMRSSDEENFDEAINAVWRACTVSKIPEVVQKIFRDAACDSLNAQSPNFWVIARAVRDFTANEGGGLLPLAGTLPDMKADTERYVLLQNIYRAKAKQDILSVTQRVHQLLGSLGRPADSIPSEEIETFCKHAGYIRVLRYRSIGEEVARPNLSEIGSNLKDPESTLVWYVMLRAAELFREAYGRYPGVDDETLNDDVRAMRKVVNEMLEKWGLDASLIADDYVQEMCRYGNAEMPHLAAVLGGMVSQEAIKLITHQYVPLDNTCVFDGGRAISCQFCL
ncbi:uncharacterized protein VTP21DRAFT_2655 [Calcarisporiella thermophila]|uniref:uncharacterized protein n=1 Tax=Calcarisporiella thermophila TaxID=911321 RepID=UPI0037438466